MTAPFKPRKGNQALLSKALQELPYHLACLRDVAPKGRAKVRRPAGHVLCQSLDVQRREGLQVRQLGRERVPSRQFFPETPSNRGGRRVSVAVYQGVE